MQFLQDPAQHNGDPDRFLLRQRATDFQNLFKGISRDVFLDYRQRVLVFIERINAWGLSDGMLLQSGIDRRIVDGKNLFYIDLPGLPVTDYRNAMLFIEL